MYESPDHSKGTGSEAGSAQPRQMAKNASDPSLRSTGSSFADLETAAAYGRHGHGRHEEDIFSTVGGFELGADAESDPVGADIGASSYEPHSEPSRILFMRGISPSATDEDLLTMFKVFGDIRHIYSACKQRGFIMVTYYDLRSAIRAQASLNGTKFCGMTLEVHFSAPKGDAATSNQGTVVLFNLDPDTSNDHMVWLFSKFGDVKGITESPDRASQKFITFFDTRHAVAAMRAMNKAEHLGKLPANVTPQLAASLSQVSIHNPAAPDGQQQHQQSSGPRRGTGPQSHSWSDLGASHGQPHHHHHHHNQGQPQTAQQAHAARVSSQPCTTAPSPMLGTSPAAGLLAGQPNGVDLQVSSSLQQLKYVQQQQQQQFEQLAAAAAASASGRNGLPVSDSASSMAAMSSHAGQLLSSSRGAMMGAMSGHKAVPSLATLSEAQVLDGRRLYGAAGGGGAQPMLPPGVGSADSAAAANQLLMDLQLQAQAQGATAEQQLWALQMASMGHGGAQANAAGVQQGMWGAGALYPGATAGHATAASASAAAAANLEALRLQQNLHDLQVRQQQQQQQLALAANLATMQGMQGQASSLSAAELNVAAAQLLQIAGLTPGLGQATAVQAYGLPSAAASMNPMGLATAGVNAAAAAHQLLQQAMGLGGGLGGMPGASGHSRLGGAASYGGLSGPMGHGAYGHGPHGHHGGLHGHHSVHGHHGMGAGRDGGAAGNGRGGGRLSRRTTDPMAEAERKMQQEKLYALDAVKIRAGEDKRTTLMIKNIPNKYTQKMLLATIDEQFKGLYDFFYLPIDFKNKCNVGYAFINMISPLDIIPLVERFNNRRWERFNSEKICNISYARIQGRSALVQHFQNSSLMHEDKRCRPILFTADGTEVADAEMMMAANAGSGPFVPHITGGATSASSPTSSVGGAAGSAGAGATSAAAAQQGPGPVARYRAGQNGGDDGAAGVGGYVDTR